MFRSHLIGLYSSLTGIRSGYLFNVVLRYTDTIFILLISHSFSCLCLCRLPSNTGFEKTKKIPSFLQTDLVLLEKTENDFI